MPNYGPVDKELADRLHNEPVNPDLGPCSCPIHRPDLYPVEKSS